MTISADQREAWAVETGHDEADATFDAICRALLGPAAALSGRSDVYAHGSRINGTHTRPLNPLDILVSLVGAVGPRGRAPISRRARELLERMISAC